MKQFAFKKFDAFAAGRSQGNPAGAIYLNSEADITDAEMQRIAQQMKGFVSEVGFLRALDGGTFALRYYSAEKEVAFCGHATIAILYDLLKNDPGAKGKPSVSIETPKGTLRVENRISTEDAVFISSPAPRYSPKRVAVDRVAGALNIAVEAVNGERPIAIVNAGLETLIVPIAALEAVLSMEPSLEESKAFCRETGVDIIIVFSDDVADDANRFRTRVFAPAYGYLEDPATGSGNAALGYYLLRQGLWDGKSLSVEQNGSRDCPNRVKLSAARSADGDWQVVFGGNAVLRISGAYFLT
jgi:PhzF family phenazine biosynthesis protein